MPPTEEELEAAFRGDRESYIELIVNQYSECVLRYIKRVTWGQLGLDDLEDVLQDTMVAFCERCQRPGFEPRCPLRILYRVARNKAIDVLRFKDGYRVYTNADATLDSCPARMKQTQEDGFREDLLEIVQTLPARQRVMMRCFVDYFEEFGERNKSKLLADRVSVVTGEEEDPAAVKSAWHAAHKTIRSALAQRGY